MSNPVVVLGKTYPSYSVVFRTVGIAPRSRKYIEDNYGNVDAFVRRYFPRCTDEEIRGQLDAQLERDIYGAECQMPRFSKFTRDAERMPPQFDNFTRDDVKKAVDANTALLILRDVLTKCDFEQAGYKSDASELVRDLLDGDFNEKLSKLLRQALY